MPEPPCQAGQIRHAVVGHPAGLIAARRTQSAEGVAILTVFGTPALYSARVVQGRACGHVMVSVMASRNQISATCCCFGGRSRVGGCLLPQSGCARSSQATQPLPSSGRRISNFVRQTGWRRGLTAAEIKDWLSNSVDGGQPDLLRLGIEAEQQLVGYVDLADMTENSAEFGIAIGESDQWGRGIGAAAGELLLRHAFDDLGLQRIDAEVPDANARSLRLVQRLGFRRVQTSTPAFELYRGVLVPTVPTSKSINHRAAVNRLRNGPTTYNSSRAETRITSA